MKEEKIFDLILKQAKKRRQKIGIGLLDADKEILQSLKKASKYVDIVVYGCKVKGFEYRIFDKSEDAAIQMVRDYKEGKIAQFVRGQVDDFCTINEFKKQFNIDPNEQRLDLGLLEVNDWQFFITGASNPDIQNLDEKTRVIDGVATWLMKEFNIKLKVAVMATCRPGSYGKDPEMDKTYDEAENIVKYLKNKNIEAKNVHIEIEKAKEWGANLLLPARGTIGNQIFRVIMFLANGNNYITPTIFPNKGIYEDGSRNEKDFYNHLIFAQSLANRKK